MTSSNPQCHEAPFSGQGHQWRVVCATGGGLLQQCEFCHRIEWTNGRDEFDAARAEAELLMGKMLGSVGGGTL